MRFEKIRVPGLILAYVLCMVFSCRRETISPNPISADSTALFSATVNGVSWQTDTVLAFLGNEFGSHARIITISLLDTSDGGSNDSTMAVQQYDVNSGGNAAGFSYSNNRIKAGMDSVWQQRGIAISGQAAVAASDGVNKKVSGTFSFK